MYRVYVRTHDQRVITESKTVTHSPFIAEAAFRALMVDREHWATKRAAVLSLDSRQLEFRRFDRLILIDDDQNEAMRKTTWVRPAPCLIMPMDRDAWDRHLEAGGDPGAYVVGVLSGARDEIILDPQAPIRLGHDDPEY